MLTIIGLGNSLRGEDAFGVDVISKLQRLNLPNTKLIETMQLTPELCLEVKNSEKIIFIDAALSEKNQYSLACSIAIGENRLSHQISINIFIKMLKTLYSYENYFEVYSMLTKNFEIIKDKEKYEFIVKEVVNEIKSLTRKS